MTSPETLASEHIATTRRYFLRLGAGTAVGLTIPDIWAAGNADHPALVKAVSKLEYLTADKNFRYVGRIKPKVSDMSDTERKAVGLTRDTWQLEIIADPDSKARVRKPMMKEDNTALTFDQLVEMGKTKAVSYLKVMPILSGWDCGRAFHFAMSFGKPNPTKRCVAFITTAIIATIRNGCSSLHFPSTGF